MSIATQTGDDGTTALLFGKRVSKTHPRIMTNGQIDALGAALGLCRAHTQSKEAKAGLLIIQKELVHFMGELACENSQQERYLTKYAEHAINTSMVERLSSEIHAIESQFNSFEGWKYPGENPAEAFFDQARTLCRSAERAVITLRENEAIVRDVLIHYLNRLSDLLWLWGRCENS